MTQTDLWRRHHILLVGCRDRHVLEYCYNSSREKKKNWGMMMKETEEAGAMRRMMMSRWNRES